MFGLFMTAVAGLTADLVAGIFDASRTDAGIKKGVAVEGNSLIVKLFGNKPSVHQLDLFNLAQSAVLFGLAAGAILTGNAALIGAGLVLSFASAGVHVREGVNWNYLIAGKNPNPKQNAFQKFIGFLAWNED